MYPPFARPARVTTPSIHVRLAFPVRLQVGLAALLVALALLLLGAGLAAAQDEVRLASLQVSLWPEYDQPATLVILDGQLDPSVTLPTTLSIRIPARAGQPYAVATVGAGDQLLTAAHTTQPAGDDIIVIFPTQSLGFRVEYYDPALNIAADARQYAFQWQSGYAIAAADVRVQQPAGARDLEGDPALTALGAGADGLSYYQASWGALQPGDQVSLTLRYAKTGSALTASTLAGAAPVPETIAPQPAGTASLPWLVGGAALGLAVGAAGVYAYRRSRPVPAVAGHRARRRPAPAQSRRVAGAAAPARFCTQCGHAQLAGDRFCRNCGARVAAS